MIDRFPDLGGQLKGLHIIGDVSQLAKQRDGPEPADQGGLGNVSGRSHPLVLAKRDLDGVILLDDANRQSVAGLAAALAGDDLDNDVIVSASGLRE
jgi:hypothetical protein